jgi:hypothetical protein
MAAAKSAGLDQTLAGPGPYTVLVPDDAAGVGDRGVAPDLITGRKQISMK